MNPSGLTQIRLLLSLLLEGCWKVFFNRFRQRIYSDEKCYGLKRDLNKTVTVPEAAFPFHVRPVTREEIIQVLDFARVKGDLPGIKERLSRFLFNETAIATPYGAIQDDGMPCFIQWLIDSRENARMGAYHGGYFPPLSDGQVLLEGAFTPEEYRGKGIMSVAMCRIAEKAKEQGAALAFTYVSHDNAASLKGCFRAGFVPFIVRRSSWRFFRQRLTFLPLSASDDVLTLYEKACKTGVCRDESAADAAISEESAS